mgnify:CR=1 FL=1
MKNSKYFGLQSGDWTCTHVGVADVQPKYCRRRVDGKRVLSKHPGSMQYYYIFERLTSDNKAMKMIRLNAAQVRQVRRRRYTVEYYALRKEQQRSQKFKDKVSYSFCD